MPSVTWFKLIQQGNLRRKSFCPCVSYMKLGHSHSCSIGSYSAEQFTRSQSVLSISWAIKTMFPSEGLRCSAFTISSFHSFSQTKGIEGWGFKREAKVFFPLCYFIQFLLCTAANGSSTSQRNLLHSDSPRKLFLSVWLYFYFSFCDSTV